MRESWQVCHCLVLLTAAQCEGVLSMCIAVVYLLHMRKPKVGVVTKVRRCRKTFEGYKTFERTEGSNLRPTPKLNVLVINLQYINVVHA